MGDGWQPIETVDTTCEAGTTRAVDLLVWASGVAGDARVRLPDCQFSFSRGEWLWQGEPIPGTATHWRYPPAFPPLAPEGPTP